ncbi:MAG: hypothetical protein IJI87_01580 [Mogibacterium sp.]|nr:hypothetical protein [Mogibacterium sp.]
MARKPEMLKGEERSPSERFRMKSWNGERRVAHKVISEIIDSHSAIGEQDGAQAGCAFLIRRRA